MGKLTIRESIDSDIRRQWDKRAKKGLLATMPIMEADVDKGTLSHESQGPLVLILLLIVDSG